MIRYFIVSFLFFSQFINIVHAQKYPYNRLRQQEKLPNPLEINKSVLDLKAKEKSPSIDFSTDSTLRVIKFQFIGNTVVPTIKLIKLVEPYLGKILTFKDLTNIRDVVSQYYVEQGYYNSGAVLLDTDNKNINESAAIVTIRIIEGGIDTIQINGSKRLKPFIVNRLNIEDSIFNIKDFEERLRILQKNENIDSLSAILKPGSNINTTNLDLEVKLKSPYKVEVFLDNYGNSGVENFQRGINFTALNPFRIGDRVDLNYNNTNGSNALDVSYEAPVNNDNTTIKFQYFYGQNVTIQDIFSSLNIRGTTQSYELSVRHPLLQKATERYQSEFAIGLAAQHQELQDSILDNPFPISRGADSEGRTRTTILKISQDWNMEDVLQAVSLNSTFKLGLDIESATDPSFNNGQFFAWSGEAVWTRKLPWDLLLISKLNLQFTDTPLVASEQFSLGGFNSLLGYSQNDALGDNGIFTSIGVQIPIYRGKAGLFTLTPTFGAGHVWNHPKLNDDAAQVLASVGVGLNYNYSDQLSVNLSWGLPLVNLSNKDRSLQDNGVLLGITWRIY
jgi:hemolysin activation/secretion protein